jgi:hypothetical protein
MDRATAHREWLVTGELIGRKAGTGTVAVRLTNGRMGVLPPFNIVVDWKPGMEPVDVVAFALGLVADAGEGLAAACVAEAARQLLEKN